MSVSLLPGIENLDPESLCYSIYNQLYHNFFNAQDRKDEDHHWGITEGDELSIRLRNTAFGFAEAIAWGINGELGSGGDGGALVQFIKKQGDSMQGKLSANYGFEAGIENQRIIQTGWKEYRNSDGHVTEKRYNVQINGDLDLGSKNLYIGGRNFISYDNSLDHAVIEHSKLNFRTSYLLSNGIFNFTKGNNSIVIDAPNIWINGNTVYHQGNANTVDVDWTMKHAHIDNSMYVRGKSCFEELLSAKNGIELGHSGISYITTDSNQINLQTDLNFESINGIKMQDYPVLSAVSITDVQLSAVHGDLFLGLNNTDKVILGANLSDIDGQYVLVSKYGSAYFPDSLTARHNFGDILLSTYRIDSNDEGIIIHKRLCFGDKSGPWLESRNASIVLSSNLIDYDTDNERYTYKYSTSIEYMRSQSHYRPHNYITHSLFFNTDAESFSFNTAIESKIAIGLMNSPTKLTDGQLFFNENNFLLSTSVGIKHYGKSFIMSDISSEKFASGFAGYGWAILKNNTTGNMSATFDELTIRKKMRIYELEVQKISATNGSLWISDNCSGDTVTYIN